MTVKYIFLLLYQDCPLESHWAKLICGGTSPEYLRNVHIFTWPIVQCRNLNDTMAA